jgi:hypothetical protein
MGFVARVAPAEEIALGLMSNTSATIDGYIGLNANSDFLGVAEHEISEVMGRRSELVSGAGASTGYFGPMDLFRYSSSGSLKAAAANGSAAGGGVGRTGPQPRLAAAIFTFARVSQLTTKNQ